MSTTKASNNAEQHIIEFNGELQLKILDRLNQEFLSTGKFVKDQMIVSPKVMSSLMLSGSAAGTALSVAVSSSMYISTAVNSPALMKLSAGGVSSAIIGEGGKIVGQAGFLPMASSLPVVAPLMAMQALSSIATLYQLGAMDKKLDAIKGIIDKMMARQEAKEVAELFTAVHFVDELYSQYDLTGHFSTDMLIRLALAERDAKILSRKYDILNNHEGDSLNIDEFSNTDTYCNMLSSFLNLRVKQLKICVDIQENPQFAGRSKENYEALLKDSIVLWDKLLHRSDKLKNEIEEQEQQMQSGNALGKVAKGFLKNKKLSQAKDNYTSILEIEKTIRQDFYLLIDIAKQVSEAEFNKENLPTLIYWTDKEGKHCIATSQPIEAIIPTIA
ncbi:MAG: hypothetical protein FWG90_07730 [Oscillospiraceae bacterium]|nr:hypothetical protein [Oscillospiraceae bacterium]